MLECQLGLSEFLSVNIPHIVSAEKSADIVFCQLVGTQREPRATDESLMSLINIIYNCVCEESSLLAFDTVDAAGMI